MHKYFMMIVLLLLCACSDVQTSQVRDGPHVLKQPKRWQALWVCDDLVKSYTFPALKEAKIIEKCGLRAKLSAEPAKRPPIRYPAASKLAVFSDIHGQFELMKRLLIANHIIDEEDN